MPVSESRKRANEKYNAANYEQIQIRVSRGQKESIKAHAAEHGESLNGFINRAITETMERDEAETDDDAFCNALCDEYERDPDKG